MKRLLVTIAVVGLVWTPWFHADAEGAATPDPPTLPTAAAPRAPSPPLDPEALAFGGAPEAGWDLFRAKGCVNCHAVWGQGGDVGPDLGRVRAGDFNTSAGQLAGTMWNHVPRMWEKMEEQNISISDITAEEMSHLFAFMLFIRYVDEPGDADEGRRTLQRARCHACHAVAGEGGSVGPDLESWARFVNPIVWAQKMWNHADDMAEQMQARGIAWPRFESRDLINIIAYVRSRGRAEAKEYLEPGSPARGRDLYQARGCAGCHADGRRGPDLDAARLPDTLAGIAARMWNHAPVMRRAMRGMAPSQRSLAAQEMADIIAYLLTRRYFLGKGDRDHGAQIYAAKGCVACHRIADIGGAVGPELTEARGKVSPVFMAYVMWRWGPQMMAEMTRMGLPWPNFSGEEMADLIAFLDRE